MKIFIKKFWSFLNIKLGLLKLFQLLNGDLLSIKVLTYHRVLPQSEIENACSLSGIIVSLENFKQQMIFLKKNYHILTMHQFKNYVLYNKKITSNLVLITFDDGWYDNYQYAFPVLKELQIPWTLFVSVNHIGTQQRFWQETFISVLRKLDDGTYKNWLKYIQINYPNLDTQTLLKTDDYQWIQKIQSLNIVERNGLLKNLLNQFYLEPECSMKHFASWNELCELSQNGATIESHGLDHELWTNQSDSMIERQLIQSKCRIENQTGKVVSAFAYPNGNYQTNQIHLLKQYGFQLAFTTVRHGYTKNNPQYEIPRINISLNRGVCNNGRFSPLLFQAYIEGVI